MWVMVHGHYRLFADGGFCGAFSIRQVTDFNQVDHELLCCAESRLNVDHVSLRQVHPSASPLHQRTSSLASRDAGSSADVLWRRGPAATLHSASDGEHGGDGSGNAEWRKGRGYGSHSTSAGGRRRDAHRRDLSSPGGRLRKAEDQRRRQGDGRSGTALHWIL